MLDIAEAAHEGKSAAIALLEYINTVTGYNVVDHQEENVKLLEDIVNTITDEYSTAVSAEAIINKINENLDIDENSIEWEYVHYCAAGILSLMHETIPIVGYAISMSSYTYDYYSSILNRARLAALQYSYSSRVALRLDKVLFG